MSDLYLHEESDYPDKNASGNEDFWSKILQPFQFQPVQKIKMCGNESHENENKNIHTSAVDLLHVRIGNLDCSKCKHCKNKARETDCLYCREVNATLIASTKITECEGRISLSSFYGQLSHY